MANELVDTLVIGAGISGLACAHARAAQGVSVRVLEATARAGGLARTTEAEGYRFEEGPEALPAYARSVRELCAELAVDLWHVPPAGSKRYLECQGRLLEVPESLEDMATSRLLSFGAKLRLSAEPTCARDEALDGSIADFARHRFGNEACERLVDPLVAGIHAGDPEQLSMRACFPDVVRMVEEHGSIGAALKARARPKDPLQPARKPLSGSLFKPLGGMTALTGALERALGARLSLSSPVERIETGGEGLRVHARSGTVHRARKVVLALPLAATRELLRAPAPRASAALATMTCENLVSLVHGYRRQDIGHALDGFGYLVPKSAGGIVLGTLFSSSIDPGAAPAQHALLRSLVGGARCPSAVELSDAELIERVTSECRALIGARAAPGFVRVARYPAVIPRFDLEHPARLRTLNAELPPGLAVLGNFTRGLGLESLVSSARELARAL